MENIKVMVNGLPGKMATEVANEIPVEELGRNLDIYLLPWAFTGP